MLEIEKRIIESDFIKADDDYISDGYILVNKRFLRNKILRDFKTDNENIMSKIPFEMGEYIDLTSLGTKCQLLTDERIGITIDEKNDVDYNFVRLFLKSFPYRFIEFTIQPFDNGYLIKAFDENDVFVGCFGSILRVDKKGDLC